MKEHGGAFSTSFLSFWWLGNARNAIVVKELAPKRGFCLFQDTHEADASHSAAPSCDSKPSKYSEKKCNLEF